MHYLDYSLNSGYMFLLWGFLFAALAFVLFSAATNKTWKDK